MLYSIANDVYFNGVLTEDFCILRFKTAAQMATKYSHTTSGATYMKFRNQPMKIYIRFADKSEEKAKFSTHCGDLLTRYINTLFHEMVHAVLMLFTCDCDSICFEPQEFGHHIHWQAATLALEQADKPESGLLGLGCGLIRDCAMALDVYHGTNLPNEAVLRKLQLNICEIIDIVQEERGWPEQDFWFKLRKAGWSEKMYSVKDS